MEVHGYKILLHKSKYEFSFTYQLFFFMNILERIYEGNPLWDTIWEPLLFS